MECSWDELPGWAPGVAVGGGSGLGQAIRQELGAALNSSNGLRSGLVADLIKAVAQVERLAMPARVMGGLDRVAGKGADFVDGRGARGHGTPDMKLDWWAARPWSCRPFRPRALVKVCGGRWSLCVFDRGHGGGFAG